MLTEHLTLPRPPSAPDAVSLSGPLRQWCNSLIGWCKDLARALEQDGTKVHYEVNALHTFGDELPAQGTMQLTHRNHVVSGTDAIRTLSLAKDFSGSVTLIPTGAWTLVTGGNITKASTAVVGQAMRVVYNPGTQMWSPSY